MPEAGPARGSHKKLITWMWVIALSIAAISMIPYPTLISWLGKLEADGSFDSLSEPNHLILALALKITALFLLICIILITKKPAEFEALREKFSAWLKTITLRGELKALWEAIRGEAGSGWYWVMLAILMVLGVLIRWKMINYPVWYDEAYTFVKFASRPLKYIITDYSAPNNHIFHSLLVALIYHLAGIHLWALRMPALSAGILLIPAAFLAGRRLINSAGGIVAACAVTITPVLVDFSVNARGYTLTCLFACLGIWFAAEILQHSRAIFWILLVISAALGFYTIPIFLYPVGGIFLWLLINGLQGKKDWREKRDFLIRWLAAGFATVVIILLLYSPVILFGSGLQSIIANDFIRPATWKELIPSIASRSARVWEFWTDRVPAWIIGASVAGFILHMISSLIKIKKTFPLWLISGAWILLVLVIQRVTPVPRIWLFLLVYYILLAIDGWVWFFTRIWKTPNQSSYLKYAFITGMLVLTAWGGFSDKLLPKASNIEESHNEQAAKFISQNIPEDMAIIGVSPTPIQVSYYLMQLGIPYNRFYDRGHPQELSSAWVIVVDKSKFPTLTDVLTHQYPAGLDQVSEPEELFTYKRLHILLVSFER